ncbi:MAG TPA: 50S ribosomal protein L18 [Elusimicrobiales bacterium]|nr:50S ribosomal protein L18 [Elusimicrobiales bacterium]HOL61875.1 50S ribosomal protein L18 [Elusimicrobiales bacterium]HPO95093.1 50S ribosomal protein L18 [Elusimicrobiales bacterium]
MITKYERYHLRKERTRRKLFERGITKPRLSVKRSNKYIYAQLIDDSKGVTLAFASTVEKELSDKIKKMNKSAKCIEACKILGETIAKRAIEKGVKEVIFDRGGRIYHGRVKAVAEAARTAGLKF